MDTLDSYDVVHGLPHGIRLVTHGALDGEGIVVGHALKSESIDVVRARSAAFHAARVRNRAAREVVAPLACSLAVAVYGEDYMDGRDSEDAQDVRTSIVHAVAEALTRSDDAFRATSAVTSMTQTCGSMALLRTIEALLPLVDARSRDAAMAEEEARTIERMLLARSPMIRNVVSGWREREPLALSA